MNRLALLASFLVCLGQAAAGEPRARLQVVDRGDEGFRLSLDGREVGEVAPGKSLVLDGIPPGRHLARAVGAQSDVHLFRAFNVTREATEVWELNPASGAVLVRNGAAEPVRVLVDGRQAGRVEPHKDLTLHSVPSGRRELEAVGEASGSKQARSLEVDAAAQGLFAVEPWGLTLHLVNGLDHGVRVYRDARFLSRLDRGASLTLDQAPAGRFLLEVVSDQEGAEVLRRPVDARPGQRVEWNIRPEAAAEAPREAAQQTARLLIQNLRAEEGRLFVDGLEWNRLPAGSELLLPQVAAGEHTLALVGAASGERVETRLTVLAGERSAWTVEPGLAALEVDNRTGEVLEVSAAGDSLGAVEPGQKRVLAVRAGRVRLALHGRTSLQTVSEWVELQPARTYSRSVAHLDAQFILTSRLAQDARVMAGDRQLGTLQAGAELAVHHRCTKARLRLRVVSPGGEEHARDFRCRNAEEQRWEVGP
jgi:hypothetical protein